MSQAEVTQQTSPQNRSLVPPALPKMSLLIQLFPSMCTYFHGHRKPCLSSSLFSAPDRVLQNTRTQRIRRHGAAATAPPRLWKVDPNIVFRRLFTGFLKTLTPRTHKIHHRVLIRLSCESEAPFCSLRFTSSLWGTGELQLLSMLPVYVESVFCFREGFDTISKGMLSTDNMGRRLGFFWCNKRRYWPMLQI
jgi:hypothetical protein